MKREAEKFLEQWYKNKHKKPLVIRGARQVGKSTLVRQFAASLGIPLWEINLERHPQLDTLFEQKEIPQILKEIEFIIEDGPISGAGILFFDEIQASAKAISALRYFHEDRPEIPVIAAGSLLEFTLSNYQYSMPVGRIEYYYLGPMTFLEYLDALEETKLAEYIRSYTISAPASKIAHDRLIGHLRDFFFVGGMPEAVASFIQTKDSNAARAIHRSILNTYRDDFGKYARKNELLHLQRVFDYIPSAVGEKFKYANVNPAWRSREVRSAVDLLSLAGVIYRVHHTDAAGIPIGATIDDSVFKAFFLDIGLMNTSCGFRGVSLEEFRSARFVNEGKIAEQYIGQHLLYEGNRDSRPELFYWLREGHKGNAEVDFILQIDGTIIPVEVKAGKSGSLRSLHQFVAAKHISTAVRFDLNQPSLQVVEHGLTLENSSTAVKFHLISLPLYMVEVMPRMLIEFMAQPTII